MNSSEEQFQKLIAQLIVRANKMLSEQNYMLPIGLLITTENDVEVVLASLEISDQIPELVNTVQSGVSDKVRIGGYKASCIAYPDYERGVIVALLENSDNYCAEVTISVNTEACPVLDPETTEVENGNVYVFPIKHES